MPSSTAQALVTPENAFCSSVCSYLPALGWYKTPMNRMICCIFIVLNLLDSFNRFVRVPYGVCHPSKLSSDKTAYISSKLPIHKSVLECFAELPRVPFGSHDNASLFCMFSLIKIKQTTGERGNASERERYRAGQNSPQRANGVCRSEQIARITLSAASPCGPPDRWLT